MRPSISAALAAATLAAACAKMPAPPPFQPVAEPPRPQVESVVFIAGDAGEVEPGRSPVLERLRLDVESWARSLARDSAVVVLFVGDNVYPEGVHARTDPRYPGDREHILAQVAIVDGPDARRTATPAIFLAGNHDWGKDPAPAGLVQLMHQATLIDSLRAAGHNVRLLPAPGRPEAAVVDVGRHLRLILLDTAWWLLGSSIVDQNALLADIARDLRGADGRAVMMASHHPFKSGSSHGGLVPFWKTLGVRFLLARSGALLQDLNSIPYRRLVDGLRAIFRETGPPLIYAGGHDHALQVIEGTGKDEPSHMLVSGAASKTSNVGWTDGMRFRSGDPGFMRVEVLRDGSVYLFVTSADAKWQACPPGDEGARRSCMEQGVAAYKTVYSARLR